MDMPELDSWDLAKGHTISQDGDLRVFRYSEFSECASPPCNTAGESRESFLCD